MLKTFSIGGVHPHENKLSAHQPIITAEVPAKAVILLGQHIGAPAKPVVAKGDVVKVGTRIAEPAGFVSAAIHSSVSGKVAKIDTIVDASGYAKPAIFIDVEGDEWEETIDRSKTLVKECDLSAEEIVKKIADAGIVGLGGACFPTQVKLCPPPSFKAECVIINAVECEPYLTADHQLMIGSQIRFTFHRIDNHAFRLERRRRTQFHLCRETSTAQTYDTGIGNLLHNFFRRKIAFFHQCLAAVDCFFPFVTFHINENSRFRITAGIDYRINLRHFTTDRRVNCCRNKAGRFGNPCAYLYHIPFRNNRFGRCANMLAQQNNRFRRNFRRNDRLMCRQFIFVWMNSTN